MCVREREITSSFKSNIGLSDNQILCLLFQRSQGTVQAFLRTVPSPTPASGAERDLSCHGRVCSRALQACPAGRARGPELLSRQWSSPGRPPEQLSPNPRVQNREAPGWTLISVCHNLLRWIRPGVQEGAIPVWIPRRRLCPPLQISLKFPSVLLVSNRWTLMCFYFFIYLFFNVF